MDVPAKLSARARELDTGQTARPTPTMRMPSRWWRYCRRQDGRLAAMRRTPSARSCRVKGAPQRADAYGRRTKRLFDYRQAPALPRPTLKAEPFVEAARSSPPAISYEKVTTATDPVGHLSRMAVTRAAPTPVSARTPALPANGCGAGGHRRSPAPLPSRGRRRPRPPGLYRAVTPAECGPRNPAWGQRGPRPPSPVPATTARPATRQDAPHDSQRKPSFHAQAALREAQFSDGVRCAGRESLSRTEQRGDGHLRRQGPGRPSRRRGPAEWR